MSAQTLRAKSRRDRIDRSDSKSMVGSVRGGGPGLAAEVRDPVAVTYEAGSTGFDLPGN